MVGGPILGKGLRADWSRVNQAWIVRAYNVDWSDEVQRGAPVISICLEEDHARALVLGGTT
jgi:hypothetical protein